MLQVAGIEVRAATVPDINQYKEKKRRVRGRGRVCDDDVACCLSSSLGSSPSIKKEEHEAFAEEDSDQGADELRQVLHQSHACRLLLQQALIQLQWKGRRRTNWCRWEMAWILQT
ncbi:hypothetical protein OPV22_026485 [Ensete ventricosum]|uniref:Uncharacterized protein n=1 Tax=Ensete ventricosum TaxID=4639 RepID=A0AAV8QK65_ENSVE|nr:hypothetical protein OPV22_026485 [Ensete ventricosum]